MQNSKFSFFIPEITPTNYSNYMRYGLMVPKSESSPQPSPMKIRINPLTQTPSTSNLANALQQLHNDSINNNAPNRSGMPSTNPITPNSVSTSLANSMVTNYLSNQLSNPTTQTTVPSDAKPAAAVAAATPTTTGGRPPQRRRVRRKANSPADDQAEHLTEMSVRGLNLFRYATIYEGIYQCTECAKENIQKTFKNKYSFQRHAFLYHEGTQRKVFPCPVCSKEFSRPDKMKNHMKMTHEAFMPKVEVYPLSYLMGGGGDMPAAGTQQQQQPTNQQQKKLQQQLQNSQMKDNVSQQIQSILNSQVENMVVTPQIQHLLNTQRMGDSASGTSTPSPTLSNHQQQQQQLLQKLQQQLTNQQNPTSTSTQSPQASPSQLRIVSAQSLNDSANEDMLTPTTIRHDGVVSRSNDKNDDAMSQFNAQMLNMQQIKVENVGPASD